MSGNNLPEDMYNPPSAYATDFERYRFMDVPTDELFWLSNDPNPNNNVAHRKVSETEGLHTKSRQISVISKDAVVFQKI